MRDMAITGDAMFNTTGPSFTSSNVYYGYVPRCRKELNTVFEHAGTTKSPAFNDSYDVDMEIDDNGYDYSMASRCLNKDFVVVESSVQNWLKANENRLHQQDTLRRRNRKRCNNSDLNPASQLKKFRRESSQSGGKEHVHYDTGSTMDHGLIEVSFETEALRVNTFTNNLDRAMIPNNSFYWAADNHKHLINPNCEQLLSNSGYKQIENSVEFEKILFETHGCSIYQFHRLQLAGNNGIEAEL